MHFDATFYGPGAVTYRKSVTSAWSTSTCVSWLFDLLWRGRHMAPQRAAEWQEFSSNFETVSVFDWRWPPSRPFKEDRLALPLSTPRFSMRSMTMVWSLGFVPAGRVSISSTLQIFREAISHLWGLLCPLVYRPCSVISLWIHSRTFHSRMITVVRGTGSVRWVTSPFLVTAVCNVWFLALCFSVSRTTQKKLDLTDGGKCGSPTKAVTSVVIAASCSSSFGAHICWRYY